MGNWGNSALAVGGTDAPDQTIYTRSWAWHVQLQLACVNFKPHSDSLAQQNFTRTVYIKNTDNHVRKTTAIISIFQLLRLRALCNIFFPKQWLRTEPLCTDCV